MKSEKLSFVRRLTGTRFIIAFAIGLVLFATLAAGAWGRLGTWFNAVAGFDSSAASAQGERVEAELITVRAFGFEPARIRRPAGEVFLVIDNRSHLRDLSLTLSRAQGDRPTDKVRDVGLRKGQVNWLDRFNLPPGDYVLTEASRPEWKCLITLTPR